MTKFWLRTTGILGILGGVFLFAGDMLFYYNSSSENIFQNMATVSDLRIILSGITALFATWFYLLGLLPVYYAFSPASKVAKNIVIISFASILTAYGIIHGAYIAIAASAKSAVQNGLDIDTTVALAIKANNILRLFVYPSFAVLSVVFIYQVLKRKTLYPKSIIFFYPLIPFIFMPILNKVLSGTAKIIIVGGYYNIILIIFFSASIITLWNKK